MVDAFVSQRPSSRLKKTCPQNVIPKLSSDAFRQSWLRKPGQVLTKHSCTRRDSSLRLGPGPGLCALEPIYICGHSPVTLRLIIFAFALVVLLRSSSPPHGQLAIQLAEDKVLLLVREIARSDSG